MRRLTLHLRARRAPAALTAALVTVGATWSGWAVFASVPAAAVQVVALAVVLAVTAAGVTLTGDDEELDRGAAVPWVRWRAVHLGVVVAVVAGLLAVTANSPARFGPWELVLRDAVGLLGLTALGATLLGGMRSWFAPIGWTILALPFAGVVAPEAERTGKVVAWRVLTWTMEPAASPEALVVAAVLGVTGTAAYLRGRRRLPPSEAL